MRLKSVSKKIVARTQIFIVHVSFSKIPIFDAICHFSDTHIHRGDNAMWGKCNSRAQSSLIKWQINISANGTTLLVG